MTSVSASALSRPLPGRHIGATLTHDEDLPLRFRPPTFEDVVLPHLDAGFALACYLLRNDTDAEDVTQQASLRALRYFDTFRGENGRAWFLAIVRNTAWSWRRQAAARVEEVEFDETIHAGDDSQSADAELIRQATREQILRALDLLPSDLREVIVLRELQECSYRDIATIIDAPIGTVMSRLSRARKRLATTLGSRSGS